MPRRRAKYASLGSGAVSFNMTPLIDIVFNLVIFFILTCQFEVISIEEVTLPLSTTATWKDTSQYHNIFVNVLVPKGDPRNLAEIRVFGRPISILGDPETSELTQLLRERKAQDPTVNLILRADAMVPYEDIARVMLSAGKAKIVGWWITTTIENPEERRSAVR